MRKLGFGKLGIAMTVVAALAACGGGGDGTPVGTASAGTGKVTVLLTDAPGDYEAVHVTVEKVRVRADEQTDEDGRWHDVIVDPPRRVDLLQLTNGQTLDLGELNLPQGQYRQIRLVLGANGPGASAMANSVTLAGGTEVALVTPSATTAGLKVKGDFEVAAGGAIDLVLDFDAHRSIVRAGNSGRYLLKPVINAIQAESDANGLSIMGNIGLPDAAVSAQSVGADGRAVVLRATVADASGEFELSPLPQTASGTVDLVIDRPGYRTLVVRDVPVDSASPTSVPTLTTSIGANAPDRHLMSGQVTVPAGLEDALVQVSVQRVVDGRSVQIGEANVDTVTRDYQINLAREVPLIAPFDATSLVFSLPADTATAADYRVQAADEAGILGPALTSVAPPGTAGAAITGIDFDLSAP